MKYKLQMSTGDFSKFYILVKVYIIGIFVTLVQLFQNFKVIVCNEARSKKSELNYAGIF